MKAVELAHNNLKNLEYTLAFLRNIYKKNSRVLKKRNNQTNQYIPIIKISANKLSMTATAEANNPLKAIWNIMSRGSVRIFLFQCTY